MDEVATIRTATRRPDMARNVAENWGETAMLYPRRKSTPVVIDHFWIAQIDRQFVGQHQKGFAGRADAHAHHRFLGNACHMRGDDDVVEAEIGMIWRQRL